MAFLVWNHQSKYLLQSRVLRWQESWTVLENYNRRHPRLNHAGRNKPLLCIISSTVWWISDSKAHNFPLATNLPPVVRVRWRTAALLPLGLTMRQRDEYFVCPRRPLHKYPQFWLDFKFGGIYMLEIDHTMTTPQINNLATNGRIKKRNDKFFSGRYGLNKLRISFLPFVKMSAL